MREALFDIRFDDTERRRKKVSPLYACEQRYATFTAPIVSVDGVFDPQTNLFIKILFNRLAEQTWIMSNQKHYTRTRITIRILRAASKCINHLRYQLEEH